MESALSIQINNDIVWEIILDRIELAELGLTLEEIDGYFEFFEENYNAN